MESSSSATSSITSIWTSINSWFTSTVFFILLNLMIATILFTSNLPTTNNHRKQEEEEDHHHQNQPKFARSPSILHRLKSFQFYPQRPEQEPYPQTHQPLEAAATQYVFNQPLHYQHFDQDPTHQPQPQPSDFQTHFDSNPTHQPEPSDFQTHFDSNPTHQPEPSDLQTHFDSNPTHQQIQTQDSYQEEEETDEFESLDEVYSRLKGANVNNSKSDGDISSKVKKSMKKSASLKVGFSHFDEDEEETVEVRRPETMREKKSAGRMAAEEEDDDDVEVDSKAADFINKFKNDLILQRIESIAARSK